MAESQLPAPLEGIHISDYKKACVIYDKNTGCPIRIDVDAAANLLISDMHIKTVLETDDILYYYKGTHHKYGEKFINRILVDQFSGMKTADLREIYNVSSTRKEIVDRIKAKTYTHLSNFDNNLDIINMANGLYNIRTGEFKSHDPTYLSLIQTPVIYDPAAKCPIIDEIFSVMIRAEDLPKIYEFMGYVLYRTYELQKSFFLLGPGGTGKSYFLDVVLGLVGQNNASSVSLQDLQKDRFASSDLYGKMVNVCGDLPATPLKDTDILKKLTSNKDPIRAQEKGKPAFNFINYAKLIFSMNTLPRSYDETSGWFRRIDIIPFEHVFTAEEYDEEKLGKLTSSEELSGLFNKVMPYLKGLLERHKFTNETDRAVTAERYKAASNPVEEFVERHVEEAPGSWVAKAVMYQGYIKFCEMHSVAPLGKTKFGSEIKKHATWLKDANSQDSRKVDGRSVSIWPNTALNINKAGNL